MTESVAEDMGFQEEVPKVRQEFRQKKIRE